MNQNHLIENIIICNVNFIVNFVEFILFIFVNAKKKINYTHYDIHNKV